MLSENNIQKLKMNGLYSCEPNVEYRGKLFENDLYHCCNWTFKIIKSPKGNYYMRDTYWDSGDSVTIKLTDENIDKFKLLFELDKVKRIREDEKNQYEHFYKVAIDSGGYSYPKYFVDMDSSKSKKLIIEEINNKIKNFENEIKYLLEKKDDIETGKLKI